MYIVHFSSLTSYYGIYLKVKILKTKKKHKAQSIIFLSPHFLFTSQSDDNQPSQSTHCYASCIATTVHAIHTQYTRTYRVFFSSYIHFLFIPFFLFVFLSLIFPSSFPSSCHKFQYSTIIPVIFVTIIVKIFIVKILYSVYTVRLFYLKFEKKINFKSIVSLQEVNFLKFKNPFLLFLRKGKKTISFIF